MQSKRDFLSTGAALALAAWTGGAARAARGRLLRAAPATRALVRAANPTTPVWAYGGTVLGHRALHGHGRRAAVPLRVRSDPRRRLLVSPASG